MSWNPIDLAAQALCAATGGHDFARHGDCLVCEHCGKRVKVKN